ncbi:DUF2490 domain-containing protein [Polaribacter sp.]|nr:DUF2490 domain-containing protein [Polaribacter sp.]
MRVLFLMITFLLISPKITAQSSNLGNWLIYIGSKKLNSKWDVHHEVQYRNYNAIDDLEQLILRTGLGYNLTENTNVLMGYGYILSKNYIGETTHKTSINEHRIFQQVITKQKIGVLKLSHRYRFEQRFVEADFKTRFRYFLGIQIPIKSSKYYISGYNEIFLNGQSNIFDRNRVYGGLGYQLKKNMRLELGYMNQLFEASNRDQINLITFINF